MTDQLLKNIIEAALFAAGKPLTIDHFLDLFPEDSSPERSAIRKVLQKLQEDYAEHGIELVQVSGGYRFQTKADLTPWLKHLQPERSPRYSRAVLETMAIIAYRQPITRREIESIRGISVSTDIMKRLQDYNWIRVLAHRDTPGRPALYGTTRAFLDYFNLKNLSDLPPLMELRQIGMGEEQAKLFEAADDIAVEIVSEADDTNEIGTVEVTFENNIPDIKTSDLPVAEAVVDNNASEVMSEIKADKIASESKAVVVESNSPESESEIASETKETKVKVIIDSIAPVSSIVPETEANEVVSESNPESEMVKDEVISENNALESEDTTETNKPKIEKQAELFKSKNSI